MKQFSTWKIVAKVFKLKFCIVQKWQKIKKEPFDMILLDFQEWEKTIGNT